MMIIYYETIFMNLPVYVEIEYKISLRTEYIQQINDLLTPFITTTDGISHILFKNNGHTYEGFIQGDFGLNNNVEEMSEEERKFETIVTIKVLGHVMGEGVNAKSPKWVRRENAVEVKVPRERVMVGDELERLLGDEKYRG